MPLYDLQLTWGTTTGCADFVAAVGALPIGFAAVLLAALARDVNVVCCAAAGMSDPLARHFTSCCTAVLCSPVLLSGPLLTSKLCPQTLFAHWCL